MLILTTSPAALMSGGSPDQKIIQTLINISAKGNAVGIISNHDKPDWFDAALNKPNIVFLKSEARQTGEIIRKIATQLKVEPHDILVLAVKPEDVQMAKNGKAVLIGAGWSANRQITELGLKVDTPLQLEELIQMTNGWRGSWWYKGEMPAYSARALVNLSSYGGSITAAQQAFGTKLTATVKNGGNRLTALLTIAARSLLIEKISEADHLIWGVYPSSGNTSKKPEVLTDFCRRLRTTVSRVRFEKTGEPLFIRHTASSKRSAGGSGNRLDPSEQITTIHLNPFYRGKIDGRNAVIIDDCTTYGVSFGVAAAFLRKAGANSVHGIALGKFGNQLGYYEIEIQSDPFAPVLKSNFRLKRREDFAGQTDPTAQGVLIALIP